MSCGREIAPACNNFPGCHAGVDYRNKQNIVSIMISYMLGAETRICTFFAREMTSFCIVPVQLGSSAGTVRRAPQPRRTGNYCLYILLGKPPYRPPRSLHRTLLRATLFFPAQRKGLLSYAQTKPQRVVKSNCYKPRGYKHPHNFV